MTLPQAYSHFHTAWESTSTDQRTLSNLVARLSMEELRIGASGTQGNSAFYMKTNSQNPEKNSASGNPKKQSKCFKCGKPGHWKRNCRKGPENSSDSEKKQHRGAAFVGEVLAATNSETQQLSAEWYLDSGASQHMSPRREWFVNFKELSTPKPVRVGTGEVIFATGKGEIDFLAHDGVKWVKNYLSEVLFVQKLKYNLFSLSSALDKGLNLASNEHTYFLKRKDSVVAVGDRHGNLYKMRIKTCTPETKIEDYAEAHLHIGESEKLRLWHERLAHQNIAHVTKTLKHWGIKVKTEKN